MKSHLTITAALLLVLIQSVSGQLKQATNTNKQTYIPGQIWMVPKGNDFNNPESEYTFKRMSESENVAIFWSKDTDLSTAKINTLLNACERFYTFYVDSLRFVTKGQSQTDHYKILIFVFKGKENTAFGGGEEKKVGIVWTPVARIINEPYGALAHELGHSFQYLVNANGNWGFTSSPEGSRGQPFFEMTSQYMLWQVYPEWMTFENYHLKDFLKKTHYAFLHETNQYHSPYVLEFWSELHGKDFIGKIWQKAIKGEDPVMTYKRLTGMSQQKFNDQIHEAACRFITWDLNRIRDLAQPYANQHVSKLDTLANGWLRIHPDNCPQNYGYNGIPLNSPPAGTKIKLEFKGIAGNPHFRKINMEQAGWRYSILAVQKNGKRIYGKIYSAPEGTITFKVPDQIAHLWLVVSGAPENHWEHLVDGKDKNDEQWPYQFRITS